MCYLKGKSLPRHSIRHLRLSVIILEPSQIISDHQKAAFGLPPAWSHFWGSDPKIMAELRIWFLRTNAGIDHICYLKTLERCYFVQIILLSHLCPRNRLQCINYRSMPVKSQQKATRAFDDQNQNACHGECARSREKMDRNWNFSLWVRPKEPFSSNGKVIVSQSMRRVDFDFSVSWTSLSTFPGNSRSDCARNQDLEATQSNFLSTKTVSRC